MMYEACQKLVAAKHSDVHAQVRNLSLSFRNVYHYHRLVRAWRLAIFLRLSRTCTACANYAATCRELRCVHPIPLFPDFLPCSRLPGSRVVEGSIAAFQLCCKCHHWHSAELTSVNLSVQAHRDLSTRFFVQQRRTRARPWTGYLRPCKWINCIRSSRRFVLPLLRLIMSVLKLERLINRWFCACVVNVRFDRHLSSFF